jgi:hypothetical protein
MIIETFSRVLRHPDHAGRPAREVLLEWIADVLSGQPWQMLDTMTDDTLTPTQVHAVLTYAFKVTVDAQGKLSVRPHSTAAQQLLHSLLDYAESYESWQYRRWLHHQKASDFTGTFGHG